MKNETYSELLEEFIDTIFGYNAKINREVWQKKVVEECNWIFDPKQVRDKLGYTL